MKLGDLMKTHIESYIEFRAYSYQIFEHHLLPYIKSLLPDPVTFKDLNMLFFIQNESNKNHLHPSAIASTIGIKLNTLSYRLSRLEANNLISRKVNPDDHRSFDIQIAPKGYDLLGVYRTLYQRFSDDLAQNFKRTDLIALVRAYIKIANAMSDEPPIRFNPLQIKRFPEWTQRALSRFYNVALNEELAFLEAHQIPCTPREWGVLMEIYIQSHIQGCTMSSLNQALPDAISTLSTIVKRYQDTLVKKTVDETDHRITHLSIEPAFHQAFDGFIALRLDIKKRIESIVSAKDYVRVIQAFKSIKTITQNPNSMKETSHA